MSPNLLLRHAWMDLLSAIGFFAVFLFRDHFERETLMALLLWPVAFEILLAFALTVASGGNRIPRTPWRNLWFASVVTIYLGLAWLGGANSGLPYLWVAALWLIAARTKAPAGMTWLSAQHRDWVFSRALPDSVMVLVPAVLGYLMLIATASGDCEVNAAGENVCKTPAWTFAVVWVPYFAIEALVRAQRIATLPAIDKTRARR